MADKKIKLSIEGQEVVCNFGVNYFYKHFYEQTKIDLLVKTEETYKELATTKIFDLLPAFYYAAYKAECSFQRQDAKLKYDDFEHAILSSDEAAVAKFLNDFLNVNKAEETNGVEKKMELQTETP